MRNGIRISFLFLFAAALGGCNFSIGGKATQTGPAAATNTPKAVPVSATGKAQATAATFSGSPPGDPPSALASWLTDPMTPANTKNGYAIAGDDFAHNQYERPLDKALAYRPDLDIITAALHLDSQWYYVTITLNGTDTGKQTLDANYGVELDVNIDGRGDYVIWAQPPFTTTWSRENVTVYGTTTNLVGGPTPLLSDAPWTGKTYDKILFDAKTTPEVNAAWVRVAPEDPKTLQIAFSPDIIQKPVRFLWGAWADDGIKDPAKFDYNDLFTKKEAGSPYKWDPDYPPKALFAVDNTCRAPYGFKPNGSLPGLCELQPTPGPQQKPGPTATRTQAPPG